ncbi:MAG TPA: hypothetical protein VKE40_05085 [Gemmataceae bacterium]|nr:hypothetical protein [Gemmataceae bacterium]
MRARALRLVRRAGLIGAALFAGAWVASGGLVVERSASLHQFPYHGGNPLVEVEVANRPAPAGVPLVARYDPDRAPFGVRVTHISHKVVEEPSITVDECYLTLPDGKRVDLTEPVRAGLVPAPFEHEHQSYVGDQERVPALRSEVTVPNCLPLDGLFRFRIRGQLRSRGVVAQEFYLDMPSPVYVKKRVRVMWQWMDWSEVELR